MQDIADKNIDLEPARKIVERFREEARTGAASGRINLENKLIPILQKIQDNYNYLPRPVLEWVSGETGIPASRMHGVITFYSQFYTEPRGKHTIMCCRGTACHVRGGAKVIDAVRSEIGLERDGTSKDMVFSLESVACLGACALAPLIVVDSKYHGKMTPDKARGIVRALKQQEEQGEESGT